jgi:hypothetical protein
MWRIDRKGEKEFQGGKEDWSGAVRAASCCAAFRPDVEEEWIADAVISCYNCRYRRWTAASFTCNAQAIRVGSEGYRLKWEYESVMNRFLDCR